MRRRYLKGLAITLVVALATISFTACATLDAFVDSFSGEDPEPEGTVRIGVFEPMSGPDKEKGELEIMGIQLANELFPIAMKKQVELIYADNQSDITIAEVAINDLIAKRPAVVLGSYGDINSLVAAEPLEKAKIPAIAITNTNPLVTSNNPYYFRVCYVETYQGIALAKFAVESLGVSTAAILREEGSDTAIALSQTFEDKMVQMTGDTNAISTLLEYGGKEKDFTSYLKKIRSAGEKVVFLPASVEDAQMILTQAKDLGMTDVKFLGTDVWSNEDFLQKLGDAAELAAISVVYAADTSINDMSKTFLKAYHAKYGEDSEPDPAVALGFDAYIIAIDSLNRIGTALDGALLAKSIALETVFPGASGNITFDINGDPMKSVVIEGVSKGEFVKLYTMEPIFE